MRQVPLWTARFRLLNVFSVTMNRVNLHCPEAIPTEWARCYIWPSFPCPTWLRTAMPSLRASSHWPRTFVSLQHPAPWPNPKNHGGWICPCSWSLGGGNTYRVVHHASFSREWWAIHAQLRSLARPLTRAPQFTTCTHCRKERIPLTASIKFFTAPS